MWKRNRLEKFVARMLPRKSEVLRELMAASDGPLRLQTEKWNANSDRILALERGDRDEIVRLQSR